MSSPIAVVVGCWNMLEFGAQLAFLLQIKKKNIFYTSENLI